MTSTAAGPPSDPDVHPAAGLAAAVVADDLSGAADCAVAFHRAGLPTSVVVHATAAAASQARTLVVATDSRDRRADEASRSTEEAARRLARRQPGLWYKKVDSTLRGHIGAELAALRDIVRPRWTIVAPALPEQGRTLLGGRGYLHGEPLEHTPLWRAHGRGEGTDLPALLAAAGLPVHRAGLTAVRAGALTEHEGSVIVCDTEREEDLAAVVAAGQALDGPVLWVGSAGLARHLAQGAATPEVTAPPPTGGARPVAIVVGSAAALAHRQFARLCRASGLEAVELAAHRGQSLDALTVRPLARQLAAGRDVALALAPPPEDEAVDPVEARRRGRELGAIVSRLVPANATLVLTGGDTARAVLEACAVDELRIVDELAPGVPLSVAAPGGRLVVTKAGAFGDDETLVAVVHKLHTRGR